MLTETAKSTDKDSPSETSLVYAARLDAKAAKALRAAMAKGLKEKYGDSVSRFATATGLSTATISNILEGKSGGLLSTVVKVCSALGIPYADIVGETLAKLAREKYAKPKHGKPSPPPVPPPPVVPRAESVTGLRVGATVPRVPLTPRDLAGLRRGEVDASTLGRLLDEYDDMKASLEKVKNKALRDFLATLDG